MDSNNNLTAAMAASGKHLVEGANNVSGPGPKTSNAVSIKKELR